MNTKEKIRLIHELREREKTADQLTQYEIKAKNPVKRAYEEGRAVAYFEAINLIEKPKKYWK